MSHCTTDQARTRCAQLGVCNCPAPAFKTQHGLSQVDTDVLQDNNPYCEPLTFTERAILIFMGCASLALVFGVVGYLYVKFAA